MKNLLFGYRQKCLCAFCGHPRKIYTQKRAGWLHILFSLIISMFFMWSYWQTWDLRAGLVFLTCVSFMEILVHFRWRLSLLCRQCGFDPLLYLKNPNLAAEQVKLYLERRKNDPAFLTAPAVKIPTRSAKLKVQLNEKSRALSVAEMKRANKGNLVSRSI